MTARALGAGLVLALVLGTTSCSGGDGGSGAVAGHATTAPAATPYLNVPDGVELTPPGTALAIGELGVVAWKPRSGKRKGKVAALSIRVTGITPASFRTDFQGWGISKELRRTTKPYYVTATVTNVGWGDIGGHAVPLFLVDNTGVLVEALKFKTRFPPCGKRLLPEEFRRLDRTKVCLVFLTPGKGLRSATFRPTRAFEPVTWSRTGA